MARRYYTLAERIDGRWTPQFGDYSRDVVADERTDLIDGGMKAGDLKVIASGGSQAAINAAIAKLNGE